MKNWYYYVIAALLLYIVYLHLQDNTPADLEVLKTAKEQAERAEDSLRKENKALDKKIAARNKTIDSLRYGRKNLEKQILTINNTKDEKIHMADSYTTGELQQYFADRYK